jgi:hypothetical protein
MLYDASNCQKQSAKEKPRRKLFPISKEAIELVLEEHEVEAREQG